MMEAILWVIALAGIIIGLVIHQSNKKKKCKECFAQILQNSEQQFDALFDQTAFGVIVLNPSGNLVRANAVFATLLGYNLHDMIGKSICEIIHPDDLEDFQERLTMLRTDPEGNAVREKRFLKSNGEYVWALLSCAYVSASDQILGQVIDITDRKEAEETIYQLAYYDTLTGLPNRLYFNEYSKQTIERARNGKWRFAVFLIDLDNFKAVNDTYGHHIGDTLLKEIARRLYDVVDTRCEMQEDEHCFCTRLGGDEFILIVEYIEDVKDATQVAELIFAAFRAPFIVGPHELSVSISVGISIYPYDGASVSSLLRSSDLALYTAKDKGKNTFFFHDVSMNQRFEQEFEYQNVIRYFLETKDFDLLYQPIIDIFTGKISGAEALLGGNKQKYPRLDIQSLILLTEDTGTIIELGELILEKACREFVQDIQPFVTSSFGLSVNVSPRQLDDPQFVAKVARVINDTGIPPDQLILEITETAVCDNTQAAMKKLHKLAEVGVRIAIDDFGVGYSSMSNLRQIHANKLKIDRSLVSDITTNPKGKEIVRTIILMSHALDLVVVAEGIENDDVFRALREIECDEAQGYLISPSLLLPDFKQYLKVSR